MQPTTTTSIDEFARVTTIIAGAIAGSVLVYMAIAWIVAPTVTTSGDNPNFIRLVAGVLAALSAGHLVAARVLFATRLRAAEKLSTPEQRLGGYRVAVIIAFAVREAVALYGLVLSFLSGDPIWCIGFGAVALMSMLLSWPKRPEMERLSADVPSIG
jgi:hypothetical protein